MASELNLQKEYLQALEQQLKLREGLPFKYGFKLYNWQRRYKEERANKGRLICAANQIGKSTIQICDRIDVATDPSCWRTLWPTVFATNPYSKPFSWYLYPNQDTVMQEFEEKWVPNFLPRGDFKDHPVYGWKHKINNKVLKYIEFNTGWRIYFKTYNQDTKDLQSGSPFAIDNDEELPESHVSELQARLFATDGYFSMAFTATTGQDLWYRAIERIGEEDEKYPTWFKQQISMYDCLEYEDGSKTPWTKDRIKRVILNCKNQKEVDRRVKGRFVKTDGLKYPHFDRDRNYVPYPKKANGLPYKGVPKGWHVYGGVDYGSGGQDNHPSSIALIAVNDEMTKLRMFKGRRYDKLETTQGDLFRIYNRFTYGINVSQQCYDWAAKDFGTMAERAGVPFNKAKKDHDLGEAALNTVLKNGMFKIYQCDEHDKLVREFESLLENTPKNKAKDDFIDAVRYTITSIPLDWEKILNADNANYEKKKEHPDGSPEKERPRDFWADKKDAKEDYDLYQGEINEWADLY
jgi:hypothetical protein